MSDLHKSIMELCSKKGISGYRLCKDTGIQPSILTDLKMGRQKCLSAKNMEKVASYFGVTVEYLLGKEDTKKAPTPKGERNDEHERIIQRLEAVDDATRAVVLRLLGLQE